MNSHCKRAFTLIELLVVVSVIVILIAILVPSLNKALYQSQLAACGAHQNGIGKGIIQYAMENKRFFPDRKSLRAEIAAVSVGGVGANTSAAAQYVSLYGVLRFSTIQGASVGLDGSASTGTTADDRPVYAQYMSVKQFEDPLCEQVGITDPQTYQPGESVYASIDLWWAIGFEGGSKMTKIGSKVTWTHPDTMKMQTYTLLAADRGVWRSDGTAGYVHSSHPDYLKRIENQTRRSSPAIDTREWASLWQNSDSWPVEKYDNSTFDRNYLNSDGSVKRISEMNSRVNHTTNTPEDDRLTLAPWIDSGTDYSIEYQLLPRE